MARLRVAADAGVLVRTEWVAKMLARLRADGTAIVLARDVPDEVLRAAVVNGRSFSDGEGVTYESYVVLSRKIEPSPREFDFIELAKEFFEEPVLCDSDAKPTPENLSRFLEDVYRFGQRRGEIDARVALAEHGERAHMEKGALAILAKAVIAASQALDIDMGDGEATYQCCNAVCGHGSECLVGRALDLANRLASLTIADVANMNHARALGGIQPPLDPERRG